jgi:hypothetical protein
MLQLLIERVCTRAQIYDLREQKAEGCTGYEAEDALLDRNADDTEQDRQAPACPL